MTTTGSLPFLALAPMLIPVLAAIGYAAFGWRRATLWVGTASAGLVLASAIHLAVTVSRTGALVPLPGVVRVDALAAYMLIVIGAIALLATGATPGFFASEIAAGRATARTAARHSVLVQLFLAAMVGAVLAADLGMLWVAVEATTICTAFLVGQRRSRAAVEAAWKYVVICSTGIALALLGALLLNYAAHGSGAPGLDLARLTSAAHGLDPDVTRIAVVLLVLGFGTKVGLAPLHAWLPDAHSQAPAPVSALMSGVLLSVAFYAILRIKVIADAALGTGFLRTMLLVMALVTLAVAATLLLAQRDYKRMLAYSSMEHMGLLALGTAVGTRLALAAVLLHVLGHGLAKAVLFLCSGRVLQMTGTSRIEEVRGLAVRDPAFAGLFGLGVFALLGFPPFSLFASELGMFRAGFAAGMGWPIVAALLLVLIITGTVFRHSGHMLLGPPVPALASTRAGGTPDRSSAGVAAAAAPKAMAATGTATATDDARTGTDDARTGTDDARDAVAARTPVPTVAVLTVGLLACAVLGVAAGPLTHLLHLAADTIAAIP